MIVGEVLVYPVLYFSTPCTVKTMSWHEPMMEVLVGYPLESVASCGWFEAATLWYKLQPQIGRNFTANSNGCLSVVLSANRLQLAADSNGYPSGSHLHFLWDWLGQPVSFASAIILFSRSIWRLLPTLFRLDKQSHPWRVLHVHGNKTNELMKFRIKPKTAWNRWVWLQPEKSAASWLRIFLKEQWKSACENIEDGRKQILRRDGAVCGRLRIRLGRGLGDSFLCKTRGKFSKRAAALIT